MTRYGCDSAYPPTQDQAQAIRSLGWDWYGGYLGGPRATHAWAPSDFALLADAGFALLPIYVGRTAPWDEASAFTAANAARDAADALALMDACGFVADAPVCLDGEYANFHTYPGPWDSYARAFCAAINAAGRKVCLYSDGQSLAQYGPDVVDLKWGADWSGAFTASPPVGQYDPLSPPPWDAWQYAGGTVAGVTLDVSSATDDFPFSALAGREPIRETPEDYPAPTWRESAIAYRGALDSVVPERDALAAQIKQIREILA